MTSTITLLFSEEMTEAVLEGRKVLTSRRTCKGATGDTFEIRGSQYRLVDVFRCELRNVRDTLFRLEGCDSPEQFEQVWRGLHGGEFPETDRLYVHAFAKVSCGGCGE